jgi:hypothetical protein
MYTFLKLQLSPEYDILFMVFDLTMGKSFICSIVY